MAFNDPDTRTILAFLERIGIPVVIEPIVGDTFLPAMTVRGGALVIDPARLTWPGDLLHEAGHIAVTDPALRPTLNAVSDSPAEEMSAIAWSWAAAVEIGLDPTVLFHAEGYRGDGASLAENFAAGRYFGHPMLDYFGMTVSPLRAAERGETPYPHMLRWLR